MHKFIRRLFLLIICLAADNLVLAQTWGWSVQFGNAGNEIITGLELSSTEDYLIAGAYSDMMEVGDTTLESMGFTDVFLSKLNSNGAAQWAVSGGSLNIDETAGISVDTSDNIVWTGQFWVQAFFGSDTIFAQSSSKAIFVAKYTESGGYLWSKSISGSAVKVVNDIVTDKENNIYLTGYFADSLFLDQTTLVASAAEDFFILKLNSDGNLIWGRNFGTLGDIRGSCLKVDSNGDIVAAGFFKGEVDFEGIVLESNPIDFDIFLVKFDPFGAVVWAKEALGVYDDICSTITIDAQNNIYLSGSFIGELSIGDGIQIATPGFKQNLFLLKYTADGTPAWARALDSDEFNEISLGLAIEIHDQLIGMTGYFKEVLKVDAFEIMAQSDGFNGFVASFDTADGKANWLRLIPGSSNLIGTQVAINEEGEFTLGGYFDASAIFDNNILVSNGLNDTFVSKLNAISTANNEVEITDFEIKVYPNPTEEVINISTDSNEFFIKIYDLHGRLKVTVENEKTISVVNLPSGNYLLQIGNEGLLKNVMFIKI